MNSNPVGVFREREIDGKPFHIYTLSSQTDTTIPSSSGETAIDGDDHLSLQQPLFLCPSLRLRVHEENNSYTEFLPYKTSPHFPSIGSVDQQVQHLLDSDSQQVHDLLHSDSSHDDDDDDDVICKLPVVPIYWCNSKELDYDQFNCGACERSKIGTNYYVCLTCDLMFHKECVESPLEIKHPSYPFLSLKLYNRPGHRVSCMCCDLALFSMLYHCPTYKLSMHPVCAMKPIPIFIDHSKRHPHLLTFFPKQASLLCDVCGLVKESFPTYVCVRCIFVVHRDCIYFPYVIKICRHQHRISFTSSLPSGKWSCGVCRQKVDNNCGAYTCNKCSHYFVHTRCALREDVWDGKDLEGVPEEHEIILEPFETIADGIILHFSHGHHLKLEISRVYDENKFCQACILPIYEGNYYSCMDDCDFILHEACANASRKKHHALHGHPLTLKVVPGEQEYYKDYFQCSACYRQSCGYIYEAGYYRIDLRCASVSEPFQYQGHEHPLFLALDRQQELEATCQICQQKATFLRKLNCIECDYVICFKCATLPYEAKYKHDKHFLTFREGKEESDQLDWCEVCEKRIVYSRKDGFYACDHCCTTLHVHCLLGEDMYMLKPSQTITYIKREVHILPNNTRSRPFCHHHDEDRCPHKVVFKWQDQYMIFCSYRCLTK
ncbi:unnamed protein product [Arabidopsis thaliana]|uniref:Zinc finger PHD-type domain-containing protein n=1 Tax=Arabidopsis thaliana TaxID=3702 RepID=A0A5S9WY64_ARATH|nr:unnamed protein product [Arabidopsis thaliana]